MDFEFEILDCPISNPESGIKNVDAVKHYSVGPVYVLQYSFLHIDEF